MQGLLFKNEDFQGGILKEEEAGGRLVRRRVGVSPWDHFHGR